MAETESQKRLEGDKAERAARLRGVKATRPKGFERL
jgi:hypothetical protein